MLNRSHVRGLSLPLRSLVPYHFSLSANQS